MGYPPPQVVQNAFLAPTSHIVRRCEIYENDGNVPWRPELWNRLIEGTITADYSRDERRSVDVKLDNYDGELEHSPTNLWYDKVLKVFYGITVNEQPRMPSILIMEEFGVPPGQSVHLKRALNSKGLTRVRINTTVTAYSQVQDFDILISISIDYTRKLALLEEAFAKGKSILTFNLQSTAAQLPKLIGSADTVLTTTGTGENPPGSGFYDIPSTMTESPAGSGFYNAPATAVESPAGSGFYTIPSIMPGWSSIVPQTTWGHELNAGWSTYTVYPSKTYRKILTTTGSNADTYIAIQFDNTLGTSAIGGIAIKSQDDASRWAHVQQAEFDPANISIPQNFYNFVGRVIDWLDTWQPTPYWETQLGEFMIDSIANDDTGETISITGRDYTTRCLNSKFVNATAYSQGANVGTIIRSIAANAGITKFNLPMITETLPRDLVYERGTERWKAMKEIADATNYEIYFDNNGFMVMRKYQDPLLTPPTLTLADGESGNLVSVSNKASSARLFNHVVVTGESSNRSFPPVAAEAKNTLASSPSSIQRIGDRVVEYKSNLVTTVAQAQELANTYLRVSSLEEFELDFSSILLPWIEPGEILEIQEKISGAYYPTRYLISSLSFPLDLGPMSGNGKRVTVVL